MRLVKDKNNYARLSFAGVEVQPPIIRAMDVADVLHWEWHNRELEVTSVVDGKHMAHSRHYVGLAFDIRQWYINAPVFAMKLRERLGGAYDVVEEKDHIHVEFDPER